MGASALMADIAGRVHVHRPVLPGSRSSRFLLWVIYMTVHPLLTLALPIAGSVFSSVLKRQSRCARSHTRRHEIASNPSSLPLDDIFLRQSQSHSTLQTW